MSPGAVRRFGQGKGLRGVARQNTRDKIAYITIPVWA